MTNVYDKITGQIIEKLEQGTIPWKKPWKGDGFPRNLVSGKEYSGINAIILSFLTRDYSSQYWLTFEQAKACKGFVKKGEKGTTVIYFSLTEKVVGKNEDGEDVIKRTPIMRGYTVFNVEQCEGLKHARLNETEVETEFHELKEAVVIWDGYVNSPIIKLGTMACYNKIDDSITMPKETLFSSYPEYYSTLFHEAVHSTGHESRLNRGGVATSSRFGDAVYSQEELVAEFGAAFLCGKCHIEQSTIDNSASYIAGWKKALKADNKMVFFAASAAQKAADYILGKKAE